MLLILAEYLQTLETAFNVFQYLTLRTILSALTALAIRRARGATSSYVTSGHGASIPPKFMPAS